MRYAGALIRNIRERTGKYDFSEDANGVVLTGISDYLIVNYMNQAQEHLQAKILSVSPTYFVGEYPQAIVANQEIYVVPDNLYLNSKVEGVYYSYNGEEENYAPLTQATMVERIHDTSTYPSFYIRRNNQILLNPIPSSAIGLVKISYCRTVDKLALRAGTVNLATIAGQNLTAFGVDPASDDVIRITRAVSEDPFVCVVDRYGTITARNIRVSNFNTGTGVFTLNPATHVLLAGESIAVGAFITVGKWTGTHSELPEGCERYLEVYAQKRVLNTDSSVDIEEDAELKNIEASIVDGFAPPGDDVQYPPLLDPDMLP